MNSTRTPYINLKDSCGQGGQARISAPQAVLDFWFGRPGEPGYGQARPEWFRKDANFDEQIRRRFLPAVESALAGKLGAWAATPQGALALLILLDQFPRNLFRNDPRAFAGDALALSIARQLVDAGRDQPLAPLERVFAYLPFEHSEALADQERAVALFTALADGRPDFADFLDYARRHQEVIARYGRFPHRNAVLGRASTEDEAAYLAQPGAGF